MIPNIVHFVFGFKEQTEDFLFCYYLSVYSAYIVNKPEQILFYYHYEPKGKWWEELKKIPCVLLLKIDIPQNIGKKPIKKIAHKADWIRMNSLNEIGGIYLDIDTICVKPWKDLLDNEVVLGTQVPIPGICNAIMFTEKKTEFFKIWLDNYENAFNPDGWEEASIFLPLEIAMFKCDRLKLKKPEAFFIPHFKETEKIFVTENNLNEELYALHLWESYSLKYMKHIEDWNWCVENKHTLYGKMMLNLIKKFIINDNDVYFADKNDFDLKDNKLICLKETNLRKIPVKNELLEEGEYYKCSKETELDMIFQYSENYILVKK